MANYGKFNEACQGIWCCHHFNVLIGSENCGNQLWHPRRLQKNMLLKRKYTKDKCGSYMYAGCSRVIITNMTPVKIIYNTKTQKSLLSFYIRRYNNQDIAVDAALQFRLNGE